MRRSSMAALAALLLGAAASAPAVRAEGGCVGCHRTRDPALVAAWSRSAHGGSPPRAPCAACHGPDHAGAAARARRSATCLECHGGDGVAVRTHRLSKHGVIERLEGLGWDWARPLARGAYRAPGCAYCHAHAGGHDPGAVRDPDRARAVCLDCHGPRYVTRILEAGAAQLAVGRLKLAEAEAALARARGAGLPAAALAAAARHLEAMRADLRALRLGVAHHSPDDQWWHGQAALDGALLRLKGAIERGRRQRAAPGAEGTR